MGYSYKIEVEYNNNGTYLVTLYKINSGIENSGTVVEYFESRSVSVAIQKAAKWIKDDISMSDRS